MWTAISSIGYLLVAIFLAALLPAALILTREELRKVRSRLVEELTHTLFAEHRDLPQIKLVSARYASSGERGASGLPSGTPREGLVRIWAGAGVFFLISLIGFLILTMPRDWLVSDIPSFPRITYALLWTTEGTDPAELARTLTVTGIAFLGGYVFQLRYLIRATLNQELGALVFVRSSLFIVQGMIVALVAYRFMGATMGGADLGRGFAGAIGIAFLFGLFPNLGLVKLAKYARVRAKTIDEDALAVSKVISLEVIDGIDAETAFRLEESNLYDIQNLAAINPIELYAETPFSLLEIFDWVLQAQLCLNVGPRGFALLKQHKIRTIFDLERGVLAEGAPVSYLSAIGAILFLEADPEFRRRIGLPPTNQPRESGQIEPDVVRHAVAIMADDLHIHRLRALWRVMIHTTAGIEEGQSPWLYHTAALPGDVDFGVRLGPAGEAWIQLAAYLGRTYRAQEEAGMDQAALDETRKECLNAIRQAIRLDPKARERLRMLWSPNYLRKRTGDSDLEPFFPDPEFAKLLDPLASSDPAEASSRAGASSPE